MENIIDNPEVETGNLKYAGFWIRFAASLIDGIILMVVYAMIFVGMFADQLVHLTDRARLQELVTSEKYALYSYSTIFIGLMYATIMHALPKQATIGKMAVGIQVGNESGEKISPLNSLGRYVARNFFIFILLIPALTQMALVFYFLFFAGFLLAVWDKQKQTLHDKIASTYVFYKK
ncbi:MAG: RDD family protein [Flavobacteriales bacterium]